MRCKSVITEWYNNNWSNNDAVIHCAIESSAHRIFGAQLYEEQWLQTLYRTQSLLIRTSLHHTLPFEKPRILLFCHPIDCAMNYFFIKVSLLDASLSYKYVLIIPGLLFFLILSSRGHLLAVCIVEFVMDNPHTIRFMKWLISAYTGRQHKNIDFAIVQLCC